MSRRTTTPAGDAAALLDRALVAFNSVADMHCAIAAQCGGLWQLAYSQGDADDQGRVEALFACLEKIDRATGPMLCELQAAQERAA